MDAIEQTLTTDLTRAAEAADAAGLTPPDLDDVRASVVLRRRRRRVRTGLLVAAAAVVVAGTVTTLTAGDGTRTEIGDDPTSTTEPPAPPGPSATETTVPSTTAPTTTSTTTPPTTAAPPPVPDRVADSIPLRAQGIGSFTFGSADAATVQAAITAELGEPEAVVAPFEPPLPPCIASPMQPDPAWRVASEVVWRGLTGWFAGPDAATQYLVGYRASNLRTSGSGDTTPAVRMAEGPAVTDPLETWLASYGSAMVEQSPGSTDADRMFYLHLPDGQVFARDTPGGDGTPHVFYVDAGVSCGGGE